MKLSDTAVACVPYYFVDATYWVPAVESGISAILILAVVTYSRRKRNQFEKSIHNRSEQGTLNPFDRYSSFQDKSILLPKYDIILYCYAAIYALQLILSLLNLIWVDLVPWNQYWWSIIIVTSITDGAWTFTDFAIAFLVSQIAFGKYTIKKAIKYASYLALISTILRSLAKITGLPKNFSYPGSILLAQYGVKILVYLTLLHSVFVNSHRNNKQLTGNALNSRNRGLIVLLSYYLGLNLFYEIFLVLQQLPYDNIDFLYSTSATAQTETVLYLCSYDIIALFRALSEWFVIYQVLMIDSQFWRLVGNKVLLVNHQNKTLTKRGSVNSAPAARTKSLVSILRNKGGNDLNEPFISEVIGFNLKLPCYDFALLSRFAGNYESTLINEFELFNHYPLTEHLTFYGGRAVCMRSLRCDYVTPQQLLSYCQRGISMINDESSVTIKSLQAVKQQKYNLANGINGKVSNLSKKDMQNQNKNNASSSQTEDLNVLSHENLIGVSGIIAEPPYLHLLFGISNDSSDSERSSDEILKHSIYGNLRYVLKSMNDEITLLDKLYWLLDIALAIQYLHSKDVIHNDIHPWNVYICSNSASKSVENDINRNRGLSAPLLDSIYINDCQNERNSGQKRKWIAKLADFGLAYRFDRRNYFLKQQRRKSSNKQRNENRHKSIRLYDSNIQLNGNQAFDVLNLNTNKIDFIGFTQPNMSDKHRIAYAAPERMNLERKMNSEEDCKKQGRSDSSATNSSNNNNSKNKFKLKGYKLYETEMYNEHNARESGEVSGFALDVYSFGMLAWELLMERVPLVDEKHQNLGKEDIIRLVWFSGVRPSLPDDFPVSLRSLLQQCWEKDPNARPPFIQIVRYLKDTIQRIEKNVDVVITPILE